MLICNDFYIINLIKSADSVMIEGVRHLNSADRYYNFQYAKNI